MVDGFRPRGEQPVQLADAGHLPPAALAGVAGDLDQELLADSEEQAFYFPASLGAARGGVGELDAEHGAAAQQPRVHESGAVINVDPAGDAGAGQGGPQRGGEPDGVFGVAEAVTGDQP